MTVDIHVHPVLKMGDYKSFEPAAEMLLNCMEIAGLDKVNAMPWLFGGDIDEDAVNFMAEFLLRYMAKRPDKFFGMLYMNPVLPIEFLTETVKKHILNGPINGVKLHSHIRASDRGMEPFASFLEKHDIPVLIHSWYMFSDEEQGNSSTPKDVAALAAKFPGLRIVMAHLRGARFRGVQDIKKHKNVGVDTGGTESEDGYLEYAYRELGAERIYMGSDYVNQNGRDFPVALGRIESLDMPRTDREKILGLNAVKLLEKRSR